MSQPVEDGDNSAIRAARNENLSHVLYAQEAVGDEKKDSAIIDVMIEQFREENVGGIQPNPAIASLGPERIRQIVLGPSHVGLLLDDDSVCRVPYHVMQTQSGDVKDAEIVRPDPLRMRCDEYARAGAEVEVIPLSGGLSSLRAATGNAKYRRVMLSNRAYYRLRGNLGDARSYILGSSRNVVPATTVPEELINNVQQVLQGKSREVIIRELQRTGLNVNEAVNNLLSRDDGDDGDLGAEHIIPEELLQILEGGVPPGSGPPGSSIAESFLEREERLLDSLASRAELRYHFSATSTSKKPKAGEKEKKKKETETTWKHSIQLNTNVEWWCGEPGAGIPTHALSDTKIQPEEDKKSPIVSIAATSYQMFALHKNGKVYSWDWQCSRGFNQPVEIVKNNKQSPIGTTEDPIVEISSSNLRLSMLSRNGHIVTWLDEGGAGTRLCAASEVVAKIPAESAIRVKDLVTSDHLTAFRIDSIIYWCGIVPLSEGSRATDKDKAERDKKKHVSFGETPQNAQSTATSSDFYVGQHVQMKKAPLYPAGSVAAHIDTNYPVIGVLLEDCWNTTEHCRFRVLSSEEYDHELEVADFAATLRSSPSDNARSDSDSPTAQPAEVVQPVSRKRSHDEFAGQEFTRRRVEVWLVEDLIWIHEHRKRDVMTVHTVDNNLVAVKALPSNQNTMYMSIYSDRLDMDVLPASFEPVESQSDSGRLRLLRKDDLQAVDRGSARAPAILQKELLHFDVDSTRTIVSMVADLNELRVLARSKHVERGMHMYRVNTSGKVISRRRVPVFLPAVERDIPGALTPKLIAFGDARTLFLRDSAGQLIPLQRDALNGFREPPPMHSQPILHIATAWRPSLNVLASCEKKSQWQGVMLVMPGVNRPWHSKYIKDGSTLMQLVLYCDADGVSVFLDRMLEMRMSGIISHHEYRQTMNEQLFTISSDLCSNVLHAAIRLSIATKNSEDVDKAIPDVAHPEPFPTKNVAPPPPVVSPVPMEEDPAHGDEQGASSSSAPPVEDEEECRWSRVLRSRPKKGRTVPTRKTRRSAPARADSEDQEESLGENTSFSSTRSEETGMPFGSPRPPEARQKSALTIVETLLKHPAMFYDTNASGTVEYLDEQDRLSTIKALLLSRDLTGMTPFQAAINQRAYGAANCVWRALLQLRFTDMNEKEKMQYIFPGFSLDDSHNADDSPLFILCYNDVCSFTWTGEDHINQDIYECKTCGLTGSLCCCSECALTCHRNHDCRLKRTSPTAYCDCWEKSNCKALIAGNEVLREYLLNELLTHTRLYQCPNARNEHIMLFLSRTVIRQTREQTFSQKRRSRYRSAIVAPQSTGTPEHNLHPPKFAKIALETCCKSSDVVLDAIEFGVVKTGSNTWVAPGQMDFLQQNSCAHLDKLAFALANKVLREYSTMFIGTLRDLLANSTQDPAVDQEVEYWVSRFVRSLVRVLTLAINVSPLAPSAILAADDSMETKDPREERIRYSVAGSSSSFQVFNALITTKKENSKLSEKAASFVAMINRIMQFLQQLPTFAVVQLAVAADAIFEPVRDGMLRPMINPAHAGSNHDPMDILEKYFASDLSLNEVLKKSRKDERSAAAAKAEAKRTRKSSRRDTDRDAVSENRESMEDERASAGDRASESHETARVRTESNATAASNVVAPPRRRRLLSGNTTNDTNEDNEERTGQAPPEFDRESSSSDEEEDNEEEDDDEEDDDDDDDDDDSDRPAEERQDAENRDDADDQDEQDEAEEPVAAAVVPEGDGDADGDDDQEEGDVVAVPVAMRQEDREEEGDWPAYVPGSPHGGVPGYDDASSDSDEGPGPDRAAPFAVPHPLDGAEGDPLAAARANQAIITASASSIAARERAIAEYESVAVETRRPVPRTQQPSVARISQYYSPYRVPQRGGPTSRRDETSGSQSQSSSSQGASSNQAAHPASTATSTTTTPPSATRPATTAAPAASTAASSQDSSPQSNASSKKSSDTSEAPTLETAREQLALTFCILVRAGCDILSRMPRPVLSVYTKADDNAKRSQLKAQRIFGDILEETFRWMGRIFESTEAKINFNEAYEKSLIRPVSPSADDKRGRKETMSYLHSLLRLATDDSKDSLAFVDVEMLYPVALVADSYFHFLNCNVEKPIELKQIVDLYEDCRRRKFREKCDNTDPDLMLGFFTRPVSLSWPGYIHDGAWDTISGRYHLGRPLKIEEECPMIGGPKVLTMKSKPEELFRDPQVDDGKRRIESYLDSPVEEFTYNIPNRPFEYRKPGASMSMVPHRMRLEQEFISITRDFYHQNRTPDEEVRDFSNDPQGFPGYIGRVDDTVSLFKQRLLQHSCHQEKLLFSKWFKTLNTIAVHFYDKLTESLGVDVAFDNSIMLRRLATFETKHKLFNKSTEKYRTQHSNVKEVILDVRREANTLFRDTMIQLHSLYQKRMIGIRENGQTPLAGTRLRVHFVDEPGEGTGVTRSFYTAFAESCMLNSAPFSPEAPHEKSSLILAVPYPNNEYEHDLEVTKTLRKARREQAVRLRTHIHRLKTFPINLNAPRFDIKNFTGEGNWTKNVLKDTSAESQPVAPLNWGQHEATLRKIHNMTYEFVNDDKIIGRVMGIMCQLPTEVFVKAVNNDDTMRLHIQQILSELRAEGEFDDGPFTPSKGRIPVGEPPRSEDEQWNLLIGTGNACSPLFEKSQYGFWTPNIGNESPIRIAAFRTVGRIMGICLSQGDIFPMPFGRHVFAYILKQPVCWLDLSFHDPLLFNSFRFLICSDFATNGYDSDFTMMEDTDGVSNMVQLKPNGDKIVVNNDNVLEYVYKYTERTLIGKRVAAFDAIREGILDVIPESMLEGLYPEDLRLILCGIESVSITVLQENTTFLDESRASQDTLTRFKQWFWQVIESFTPQEKQDLVFFWTGSPSLPAAGKWQTAASVMLRPQEDLFLPTANTCISRIYVPVYSTKRILRSKLLMAIKAKNFGFV